MSLADEDAGVSAETYRRTSRVMEGRRGRAVDLTGARGLITTPAGEDSVCHLAPLGKVVS